MTRPTVQLPTENQVAQLRSHLDRALPQLMALPGVEGITLNGGMSRGYADHLSEVDVTLYLGSEPYGRWQQGELVLPSGILMLDGQLYDIKLCSLEAERQAAWTEVARWDGSYAEVLYDPEGKVSALLGAKLAVPPRVEGAGSKLFSAWWHFELATNIWVHRQDGLQAHLMLNRALEPLVGALFAANQEYAPHEKWLVHLSRSLPWKPERWEERLALAFTVREPSVQEAVVRRQVIADLWDEIDRYAVATHFPGFPLRLMQQFHYGLLRWVAEEGEVPLVEWRKRAGGSMLSADPFRSCTSVVGGMVRLDRTRMAALGPADMYDWFYEIVKAVRG